MTNLDSVLRQIEKPIQYATANQFRNLPLVHNLGRFVLRSLSNAAEPLSPAETLDLNDLRELFVDFDGSPLQRRRDRLTRALDLMSRIRNENICSKPDAWSIPIQYVKGVGPKRAQIFERMGMKTLEDLISFMPRRYEDRSVMRRISALRLGEIQTIQGRIVTSDIVRTRRRGLTIFEAVITDGTGVLIGKWFNQGYLKKSFIQDRPILLSGMVGRASIRSARYEMVNPQYELPVEGEEETLHTGRIVPVYHESRGVTSRQIRRIIRNVLDDQLGRLADPLPDRIRMSRGLVGFQEAVSGVHFPPDGSDLDSLNQGRSDYHRRLAFDEFFLLSIGLAHKKRLHAVPGKGVRIPASDRMIEEFQRSLPFRLTQGQEKAIKEVFRNMSGTKPMHRLLQGDVGCGKTTVALAAMVVVVKHKRQAALMAPTEILAAQHYLTLKAQSSLMGFRIALVTGGRKTKTRQTVLRQISKGEVDIVIGTHALISEAVAFQGLALAVVDEQHKFGVAQRLAFSGKGPAPHVLIMTATPIPRTLALTVYGDLDLTVIRELPAGRSPIETRVIAENRRDEAYRVLENAMAGGRQAYVVYPIIEESEQLDLKAAIRMADHLQRDIFPSRRVALLHGKMDTHKKEAVMISFKAGEIDLLVATSVIEVGIDVPNATVMAVEHAERFGLAQLHQLRGRVGRGIHPSICLLLTGRRVTEEGKRRLAALVKSQDGFIIAEEDLAIRGPGEFFGTRQSGLPELRVANILRDASLLEEARTEAQLLLDGDPFLTQSGHRNILRALERKWEGRLKWVTAG